MATYDAGDARLAIFPDASQFKSRLEADLKKIDVDYKIPVHPNLAQATADLDRWRQQQQRNAVELKVDVDTAAASAKIGALERTIKQAGGGSGGSGGGGILGALKLNAGVLGVGSLPAVATAIATVASSVQQLAGAGAVLPGVFAGIAATVGTVKVGLTGVSDAFKAVDKSSDGTAKSIKAANDALAKLAPSAAEAVKAAADIKTQLSAALVKPTQQNLFDGLADSAHKLVNADLPTVQRGMAGLATAINGNVKQLATSLGSESSVSFLDRIFGNTADAQTRASAAIDPIVHAMGTLAATGSDALPRLADGLGKVSTRFDSFISKADADGRLDKWINDGITGLDHLGNATLNIGKTFTAITQAAGGGDGLLGTLDNLTGRLATFLNSDEGQADLTKFFQEGRDQLAKWAPIIENIAKSLPGIYQAAKQWTDALLPALGQVTGLLTQYPDLIQSAVTGFVAWKSISGVASLLGKLGGIGTGLDALPGKATGAAGGISNALSKIAIPAAITALTVSTSSGLIGSDKSAASDLGGLGVNVAGGAAAGASVGGAPGAIVGAIAGLGVSVYQRVLSDVRAGQKAFEDQWQSNHDNPDRPGNPDAAIAARGLQSFYNPSLNTPTVNASLLPAIKAGQVPGFSVGPDGQIINTATGQTVTVPGLNLAPAAPAAPPPPKPVVQIARIPGSVVPTPGGIPLPAVAPTALDVAPSAPAVTQANPVLAGPAAAAKITVDPGAQQQVDALKNSITTLPEGKVQITDPSPAILDNLKTLGAKIETLPEGKVVITPQTDQAAAAIDRFIRDQQSKQIQLRITAAPAGGPPLPVAPGHARGGITGILPGYSPGVDNMLVPMSGGEGVLIPQVTRKLGPAGIAAINGGALTGYATGGVVRGGLKLDTGVTNASGNKVEPRDVLAGVRHDGPKPLEIDVLPGITADDTAAPLGLGGTGAFKSDPFKVTDADLAEIWKQIKAQFGYATGGIVDKFGNPVTPGAAPGPGGFVPGAGVAPIAPNAGDGGGIFGSILSGLSGAAGNVLGLGSSLTGAGSATGTGFTPTGSFSDRLAGIPGLAGLIGSAGSSNPGAALTDWGSNTGKWLGTFTAKTVGGFGNALWQGALGAVGLENSILSPNNPWFQDAAKGAGFALNGDGPLAALLGVGGSSKAIDPKKIREGGQKVQRADQKVAQIMQRISELKPNASKSSRQSLADQLANAQQDAADARTDLNTLTGGADPGATTTTPASATPPNGLSHHGGPGLMVPMSGGEGIISPDIAAKLGPDGIAALNQGILPHGYATGGIVDALVKPSPLPPPPRPATRIPDANRITAPTGGRAQVPAGNNLKPLPGPIAPPAPAAPPAPSQPNAGAAPFLPGAGAGAISAAPSDYNHNLSAVNTGITSAASAIGNIASQAIAAAGSGSFGVPGAGALGQMAAGAIQEGGKVVSDLVNVGSSFLVGSVPGNLGGDGPAQGQTLVAPQNVPQTAQDNRSTYNIQAGYRPADLIDAIQLHDAQTSQGELARFRG